jgi:hypothetical protein
MRLRSRRRNLIGWSQSASTVGRYGAPPFTRTRRIRRWIRTGALLAVVGLMPLARAVRARWRPLLAGGVLTVAGVILRSGPGGMLLFLGLVFLTCAPFVPASPQADRMPRWELIGIDRRGRGWWARMIAEPLAGEHCCGLGAEP